jgi:hypothetical protein
MAILGLKRHPHLIWRATSEGEIMENHSIEELITYIEKYRTGFRHTLRGASEDEIQRLARFAPHPLPTFYQDYLR